MGQTGTERWRPQADSPGERARGDVAIFESGGAKRTRTYVEEAKRTVVGLETRIHERKAPYAC